MDLVTGALGSLVPKLLQLLGDEYKLQTGVKKEIQSLSLELKSIHAFLGKVADVPWDQLDEQVKVWAHKVREASYDMDDILDTFLVRVEGRGSTDPSRLKRAMEKMANLFSKSKARREAGCAIKDIMKRLKEVADRRARYRITDIVVNPAATMSTVDPRLHAMYKEVAHLVGIDKPSDELISLLSPQVDDMDHRKKKLVSVVGIGGLGKTTLAKAVYDKLRVDFDCGAFVSVGRNPSSTEVFMDILYHLDKKRYEDIHNTKRDTRLLIEDLQEFLKNKRYFIVIDDIWEKKSWETIKLALFDNNCGSRIIITTRNTQVAKDVSGEVYNMQPLSDDNSEKLFYTRIFGDEVECPDDQPDEAPSKILKKCGGIPLAIITMASLLVGKPRDNWSDVFTSIGFGHKDNQQVENTRKILSYSYYDMPSYLRTCLLYLSVFPEDHSIDKDSLIWKWIAEGFVQEKQGIRLFELGERYFNDLINRSMIQAIENEWAGIVYRCRVHDMILDLLRSMSSKENFVTISDNSEGKVSPPSGARRLAHHEKSLEHTSHANMVGMAQVRSFIACRSTFDESDPLSSFRLLRVLALVDCKNVLPSHLVHLRKLLRLRYLGLEGTTIDKLPNEIGALKFLQTLNLSRSGLRELTPSISQLTQLVCLRCDIRRCRAPDWIEKLTSLEVLEVAIYANGLLKMLGSLTELRVLSCTVDKMDEDTRRDLSLSLRNLHKLCELRIICLRQIINVDTATCEEASFDLPRHLQILYLPNFWLSRLPSCIRVACLPKLSHLHLHVDAMDEEHLELLGRLPELCYLQLHTKSTVTVNNINASSGYFQKLRFCVTLDSMVQFECKEEDSSISFHIWNANDAMPFGSREKDCSVQPSAVMPNLEVLRTEVCVRALKDGNGDCGNIGLEYLTSLQKVEVWINCKHASEVEVDEAQAALRIAAKAHPNCPTLKLYRRNKTEMIPAVQDQELEDDDVPTEEEHLQQLQEEEALLRADDDVTVARLSLARP